MKYFLSFLGGLAGFTGMLSGLLTFRSMRVRQKMDRELSWHAASHRSFWKYFWERDQDEEIEKVLPDFFDLLAVGVSAGQNLEQSFLAVVTRVDSLPLRRILDPLCVRIRLGLPREAAFRTLQEHVKGGAAATIGLLIQGLRHGNAVEKVLREQAESLRRQHQIALEKKAQVIGLKLLIPIGVFLLPALLLLFFGGFAILMRQDGGLLGW